MWPAGGPNLACRRGRWYASLEGPFLSARLRGAMAAYSSSGGHREGNDPSHHDRPSGELDPSIGVLAERRGRGPEHGSRVPAGTVLPPSQPGDGLLVGRRHRSVAPRAVAVDRHGGAQRAVVRLLLHSARALFWLLGHAVPPDVRGHGGGRAHHERPVVASTCACAGARSPGAPARGAGRGLAGDECHAFGGAGAPRSRRPGSRNRGCSPGGGHARR